MFSISIATLGAAAGSSCYTPRRRGRPKKGLGDNLPLLVKLAICVITWIVARYCVVPVLDWMGLCF